MSDERKGKLERFEQEFRSWGQRPSGVPAGAAAARVRARIGLGRVTPSHRQLAWLAAVVLAVVGTWLVGQRNAPATLPSSAAAQVEAVPLPDNVVLWWLDSETPVYFVIRPARPGEGGQ